MKGGNFARRFTIKVQDARLGNRGPPDVAAAKGRTASLGQADRFAGEIIPIIRAIQRAGIKSLRGIAEALEARGGRTARGRPLAGVKRP